MPLELTDEQKVALIHTLWTDREDVNDIDIVPMVTMQWRAVTDGRVEHDPHSMCEIHPDSHYIVLNANDSDWFLCIMCLGEMCARYHNMRRSANAVETN